MTKKQVIKISIFILLVIWMLIHLTYALRVNGDVKDRFVGSYAEKKNTVDAIIIGSSPVGSAISTPKIYGDMGITMYPLSSNVQRPVASKYLVEEALKTQDPELIIFEIRMWNAPDEYLWGNMAHTREVTDNLKYSLNRVNTINAMVEEPSERLSYYLDIFKYHSNWKTLLMWEQLRTMFYNYPHPLKGYVIEDQLGPAEVPVMVSKDDKEKLPYIEEEYLKDLLSYLKEKNLKALFVLTPYLASEEEQKKFNYMADIVEEAGFDYLNMLDIYQEIGIDFETDIRDYGSHVNALGGYKVTEYFEKYIREKYVDTGIALTKDHRGDSSYSSWDAAYELYTKQYEEAVNTLEESIRNKTYYDMEEEDQ